MNKQLALVISVLAALLIIPFVIWGIIAFSQRGTVAVSVYVAPHDASIAVGDQHFSGSSSIRVKPGSYTVTISKDGFQTNTQKIIVRDNKPNSIVSTLTPVSAAAQQWYKDNQDEVLTVEGKAGELAAQQGQDFIDNYPITKWLPLDNATFTIGYKQVSDDPSKGIIITISALEGYREAALQQIRDKGFDPSDYTIEFTSYRNPFNE